MPDRRLERLEAELVRPPFHAWLRPEPVSATNDTVEIRLPIRQEMAGGTEPFFVHGGIIAALIDLTGYAAAACATGCTTPTLTLQIDYLRPAFGGMLLASGVVRQKGKRNARVDVEIIAEGRIIALGRGTFAIMEDGQ